MSDETPVKVVPHRVDWLVTYPENFTPILLLSKLNELAADWPGWARLFPSSSAFVILYPSEVHDAM